jgi:hypothetical protein
MLVQTKKVSHRHPVQNRKFMKLFFIQAVLFSILIGLQHSAQWHWLWVTTFVLAVAWIWFLIVCCGLVITFINHPRVERRILVNTKKMTATKRFLFFAKDWCFAMIWLVLLASPYMALGQILVCAMVHAINTSLIERRSGN